MKRRNFLYGLGLTAGTPLLQPFLSRAVAEEGPIPRRLVLVVEGNGVEPGNLLSAATREALETETGATIADRRVFHDDYSHAAPLDVSGADLATAPSLSPLGATDTEESLEDEAAVLLGLSNRVSGGGHSTNFGALSCSLSRGSSPTRSTVDHEIARFETMAGTPFDTVRIGYHRSSRVRFAYQTCASGPGQALPIVTDPTTAFNMLFGSVASASGQKVFADRRDLLDFAGDDVNAALKLFPSESQERQKLERYLEAVEQLTAQHEQIKDMGAQLEAVLPTTPSDAPDLYGSKDALQRFDIMGELAGAALLGGLTNVVVLSAGTGLDGFNTYYPSIDAEAPGRHQICHGSSESAPYREILRKVTERHVQVAAKLARQLRATPEGGGTMLDHTAIVFMSDNGHQHHSNAKEWPTLLLGGRALGLRTGNRSIVYPGLEAARHRQVSNLFNTLTYAAGQGIDDFGEEGAARVAEGPLDEIYG